jgi:hypothetical protein
MRTEDCASRHVTAWLNPSQARHVAKLLEISAREVEAMDEGGSE